MNIKKIMFVADAGSIHTKKWVDYFIESGYDVFLATFSKTNITNCRNIFFLSNKNVDNRGGNYYYLFYIFKLAKIFNDVKPNIINAHFSYSMGLVSFLAKKISRIKALFSVVCHGDDILNENIFLKIINKTILKRTDAIFAVSDQIRDKILSFGIDASRVFAGQYGIEKVSLKYNEKNIDILSNRAFVPNSRIEEMLEYLKYFKNRNLKIVFVLPHISENDLLKLKQSYSFIDFYKSMDHGDLLKKMDRTKIYISNTKSDGTSLSLMEAMACGAIPVVSNILSNRSWILDGVNGFLFNDGNQFIDSIEKILGNNTNDMVLINQNIIKQRGLYMEQMKKIEKFINKWLI